MQKSLDEFYKRSSGNLRHDCKKCHNKKMSQNVSNWRRTAKEKLVNHFGAKCLDCSYQGPPFMFDFDHRDPCQKEFGVSGNGLTRSYAKMLAEAEKCDLVCARCHQMRTHRQRCVGCKFCTEQ